MSEAENLFLQEIKSVPHPAKKITEIISEDDADYASLMKMLSTPPEKVELGLGKKIAANIIMKKTHAAFASGIAVAFVGGVLSFIVPPINEHAASSSAKQKLVADKSLPKPLETTPALPDVRKIPLTSSETKKFEQPPINSTAPEATIKNGSDSAIAASSLKIQAPDTTSKNSSEATESTSKANPANEIVTNTTAEIADATDKNAPSSSADTGTLPPKGEDTKEKLAELQAKTQIVSGPIEQKDAGKNTVTSIEPNASEKKLDDNKDMNANIQLHDGIAPETAQEEPASTLIDQMGFGSGLNKDADVVKDNIVENNPSTSQTNGDKKADTTKPTAAQQTGTTDGVQAAKATTQADKLPVGDAVEYRIVDRKSEQSGFRRMKNNDPKTTQWFLVIEAIDKTGKPMPIHVQSMDTSEIKEVKKWAIQVSETDFRHFSDEKLKFGSIPDKTIGTAPNNHTAPQWSVQTTGSMITEW